MVELKLSNGFVLDNPEERIRDYCKIETYAGYDDCHEINNTISMANVRAANKLFARISNEVALRMMRSGKITDDLAAIDNGALGEIDVEYWKDYREKLRKLLLSFTSVKGVGIAVATKILHLKRPQLIPILDSFVVKFLLGVDTGEISDKQRLVEIASNAFEIVRADIKENQAGFITLRENLADLPIPLETVRLYDILVWSTEKWDVRGNSTALYGEPTTNKRLPIIRA